eukprot:TRINITY_DN17285_c0_g1_i1.p1 TRINITY_DN17285_c0_g1~~TRINITY_DN17285_c0_g1_i1.p1  ORF type:complete len:439 (+),score=72.46 TRINITY_DN17285_c0_g1_i1:3-1319(+)
MAEIVKSDSPEDETLPKLPLRWQENYESELAAITGAVSLERNGIIYVTGGMIKNRYYNDELIAINVRENTITRTKLDSTDPYFGTGAYAVWISPTIMAITGGHKRYHVNTLAFLDVKTAKVCHLVEDVDHDEYNMFPPDRIHTAHEYQPATALPDTIQHTGAWPLPTDKHVMWRYGRYVFMFGGWGTPPSEHDQQKAARAKLDLHAHYHEMDFRCGWNNLLYVLDVGELVRGQVHWYVIPADEHTPSPRAAASVAWDDSNRCVWLLGGRTRPTRTNDLYRFDPLSLRWSHVAVPGDTPCVRSWQTLTYLPAPQRLVMFGGLFETHVTPLCDVWSYDTVKNRWVMQDPAPMPSAGRIWHQAHLVEEAIYMVGGSTSYEDLIADDDVAMVLRLNTNDIPSLKTLCLRACRDQRLVTKETVNKLSEQLPTQLVEAIAVLLE